MISVNSLATGRVWAQLSRPQNVLYPGLLAAGAAFIAARTILAPVLCYIYLLSMYALAAALNNLRDIQTDMLNKREDNPFVYGKVQMLHVAVFCVLHVITLTVLQFLLKQPGTLVASIVYILLVAGYSHAHVNLQARGWLAPLVLAVNYGCLPVALGFLQAGKPWTVPALIGAFLQIFLLFPLLLAKDYKDLHGDRLTGKNTPLVRYGKQRVILMARAVAGLAAVLYVVLGIWLGGYVAVVLAGAVLYGWFVFALHTHEGAVKGIVRKLATIALVGLSLYPVSLIY